MVVLSTSISPSQMRLYLVCTVHFGPELIKSAKIFQREKKSALFLSDFLKNLIGKFNFRSKPCLKTIKVAIFPLNITRYLLRK